MSEKTKIDIRKEILNLLRNQKEEERVRKSLVILEKLFTLPEFQKAQTILFYASFDGEVETLSMIQQAQKLGKTVALPTILQKKKEVIPTIIENLEEDLEQGPFGIAQCRQDKAKALDVKDIDMVIVPGVAFDKNKNRLGRGQGYYDRFLKSLPDNVPSVGLAFDFQITECLPHHDHDVPVNHVITN